MQVVGFDRRNYHFVLCIACFLVHGYTTRQGYTRGHELLGQTRVLFFPSTCETVPVRRKGRPHRDFAPRDCCRIHEKRHPAEDKTPGKAVRSVTGPTARRSGAVAGRSCKKRYAWHRLASIKETAHVVRVSQEVRTVTIY